MPLHDVLRQRLQPLTAAVTSNRIFLYSVFSTFAVAATIANACRAQSNFYSVSIYLSKSSRSVLVRIFVPSSLMILILPIGSRQLRLPLCSSLRQDIPAVILWHFAASRSGGMLSRSNSP